VELHFHFEVILMQSDATVCTLVFRSNSLAHIGRDVCHCTAGFSSAGVAGSTIHTCPNPTWVSK